MTHTQSRLYKLAFLAIAIVTASMCSYMEGKVAMQAKMERFEADVQQEILTTGEMYEYDSKNSR